MPSFKHLGLASVRLSPCRVPAEGFFSVPLVLIAVCIAWSGCAIPAGLTTSWHLKKGLKMA
jgi:hypothetical protein